jgi:DNA-binding CsgD family transcriptional regulator
MTRLDRRDYEAVLSFLEEAHAVEEPAPFTPHLLDRLASLAHCELATFFEFAPGTNLITVYVPCSKEDPQWRGVDDPWWTCTRSVELRRWKARDTGPIVLADVFPRRLRVDPDFNLNYEQYGVADEIGVSLDRDRRWTAEVGVFGIRDFGERERLILQLLQPHLAALYRAAKLRRRLGPASDAARLLTRREREVMAHVSNGLTNAEIARALVIEPSTVCKHLEHVFEKLGVGSRTAALAKLRAKAASRQDDVVATRASAKTAYDTGYNAGYSDGERPSTVDTGSGFDPNYERIRRGARAFTNDA